MATQKAADACDDVPSWVEGIDKLYDLLEAHRSRPSIQGQDWVKNHWFQPQSVVDRIRVLQKEVKVRRGKGEAITCAVLGVSLASAVEERKQKSCQADTVIDSLQMVIQTLQEQLKETKQLLEEERNQNVILKEKLRDQLLREADTLAEVEVKLSEKGIRQIYPQGDLQKAKETVESLPHMYPLVKTDYVYKDDSDNRPQVITKEVPFTATELAKLRKDFARTAKESETEYVWRVSLSGGDGLLLLEKEAEGYWGPGVLLTTGGCRAPWSLTQRAACWARGLNPLERGDPLAITGTVDQLVESVQKAACLQMMCDRELKPNQGSPVMLPVDPERMTPLIWGLPDSLKPIGIQLQGKIQNTPNGERITAALEGIVTPDHQRPGRKVWIWGKVAQELINFGRKYGPVGGSSQRTKPGSYGLQSDLESPRGQNSGRGRPLTRQGLWQLVLQKGIPWDLMDGLPAQKLEQLVQKWSGQRAAFRPTPNAPPLIDLEEEPTGEKKIKMPESKKDLQHALGLLVFWKKHIPDFSSIARPLYDLLRKRAQWEWTRVHDTALQLLVFEATAYQALGPIHPTDPVQIEWGFAKTGLSIHLWQKGPEGPVRPIGFYSRSFKDAEKRYTTWEKGLFVVSLALREAECTIRQQPLVFRGPFKAVLAETPLPDGVAQRASVRKWYAQTEHYCEIFSVSEGAMKVLNIQDEVDPDRETP
ncbi:uncharacterized protein LOC141941203 [Strix uralensis]|uniref:uncharacterized protein LOC141941203 n=1 Tax=Strix uralensis TaxID=36305 RepID=UPI003DA6E3DF